MSDSKWERQGSGNYRRTEGPVDVMVRQEGELWITLLYYDGALRDCGEWDGRDSAFRNALGAMKRAVKLRSLPVDPSNEDGFDDDDY